MGNPIRHSIWLNDSILNQEKSSNTLCVCVSILEAWNVIIIIFLLEINHAIGKIELDCECDYQNL